MNLKRYFGTLVLLFSLFHFSGFAKTQNIETKQQELDELVGQFHKYGLFSGVVNVVSEDLELTSVAGYADLDGDLEMSQHNQFGIGSVSKTFTAMLVLKLAEDKKLSLNDKLVSWFPELKGTPKQDITLLQLLRHRSGIVPHFRYTCWREDSCSAVIKEGKLLQQIFSSALAFKPGEDRLYGNGGYYLIAKIIERATKQSFSKALSDYVLKPLSLTHTYSRSGGEQAKYPTLAYVPAADYDWKLASFTSAEVFLGGADIVSNARDLAAFQQAVFSNKLVSKETLSLLVEEQFATPWYRISGLDNWYVVDGQVKGESAIVAHNPIDNVSLQILSNQGTSYWHKKLLMLVTIQILNGEGSAYVSDYASFPLQRAVIRGNLKRILKVVEFKPENLDSADVSALIQQLDWAGASKNAATIANFVYHTIPSENTFKQLLSVCNNARNSAYCYPLTNPGMSHLYLQDQQRKNWQETGPRPLNSQVFYPSFEIELEEIKMANGGFTAGTLAVEGDYWGVGKRPLILLSHGTGGSLIQHLWLTRELTRQGYIVAGVNHHGNTAVEQKYQSPGFLLWWERSRDLRVLLDSLKKDSTWSSRIDFDKVAVAGFSLGGYTAMSVMGAKTDRQRFRKFCQSNQKDFTCEPQLEFEKMVEEFNKISDIDVIQQAIARESDDFTIPELKGAFAIAPGVAQSLTKASLSKITKPVYLVVGSKDKISPEATNARYLNDQLPNSEISLVIYADHYTFLSQCTQQGNVKLGKLCESSADRKQHHAIVAKQAVDFFKSLF